MSRPAVQRGALVAARGDAVTAGEPAREVGLAAEPGRGGGRGDGPPRRDQLPCGAESELALVVPGRYPVGRRERAVDGEPAPARRGGQVGGGDVAEVAVADQLPGPPRDGSPVAHGRGAHWRAGRPGGPAPPRGGPRRPQLRAGAKRPAREPARGAGPHAGG